MSLNHIFKDVVADSEKLDVKFGSLEADTFNITNVTFTDLTISNDLNVSNNVIVSNDLNVSNNLNVSNELNVGGNSILKDVVTRNLNTTDTVLVGNNLVVNNLIRTENGFVQTNSVLFKSKPFLNSTTFGPYHTLFPDFLVNGMAIFDDPAKGDFDYKLPYKADFDNYFFLTGAQEYAFRFNVAIFANIPSNNILRLVADDNVNSGIYFNYIGTRTKVLTHSVGTESNYSFVGVRQADGNYIIYG